MTTTDTAEQYARIRMEPTAAAAFVAALSRFLRAPAGEPFTAGPALDVRAATTDGGEQMEVYLDHASLRAAATAFAPLPELDLVSAADLPAGTTSVLDARSPARGSDEMLALLPTPGAPKVESDLRARLQADLMAAMRARDAVTVSVLRTTLAAIGNAEAVPTEAVGAEPVIGRSADVPRRDLDEEQLEAIVEAERRERLETAALYRRAGRPEAAVALEAETKILARYLPAG